MKASLVWFVAVVALVAADLTDEQRQKIIANGKECIAETGADKELIQKARKGTFTDDAKLKAFTFCMSKKFGFQSESGDLHADVVKEKLGGALGDNDAAAKLIEKCLKKEGTNEDTAFNTFKCYYENTPTHLTVF